MSHFPFSYLFSFVSTKIGKNPVFDILLGNQTSRSGCFIFTDFTLITRQKGLQCYMEHTLSRIYIYFLQNLIFLKSFKVVQLLVNGKLMLELYFMIWHIWCKDTIYTKLALMPWIDGNLGHTLCSDTNW